MNSKPAPAKSGKADVKAKLQEAQDRMKAATERHAAVVTVLSRVGGSPQDKRLAQAESKKAEHEVREAKRLLEEAQALANGG
jgi:hypothetical protein